MSISKDRKVRKLVRRHSGRQYNRRDSGQQGNARERHFQPLRIRLLDRGFFSARLPAVRMKFTCFRTPGSPEGFQSANRTWRKDEPMSVTLATESVELRPSADAVSTVEAYHERRV